MSRFQNDSTTDRAADWRSLHLRRFASGYRIREDARRFRGEVRSEIALRFTGIALLLGGWFMWLLPSGPLAEAAMWSKVILSGAFGSVGLALFLWANRGFRREIRADMKRSELRICKLNARGQALVTERLKMDAVESMYVRRFDGPDGMATLVLRMAGRRPMQVMRGREEELTQLHRMLCRDMNGAAQAPQAVQRPGRVMPRRVTVQGVVRGGQQGRRAQTA